MLFRISPAIFWNLIAKKYAASPIQDKAAYDKKLESLSRHLSEDSVARTAPGPC